jgi:membrane protease YdiL (CAAX protease family)
MTTNYDFEDEPLEDSPVQPSPESAPNAAAPRVWTVFVAFVLAQVGIFAIQIVLIGAVIAWRVANGANIERLVEDLPELLSDPVTFIGLLLSSQLGIGVAAILPALLSREPTLSRLGLTAPSLPKWGYPIIMLGSGIPMAAGLALFYSLELVMAPDSMFDMFYKKITWAVAGPFVLFVSLAPGFIEEMFFRGYMQRRFLQRWSPWTAILVSSALFALMHVSPHTVLFAFPLGVWFGVIAWRTGSVWPCIVCHALVNAGGSIYEIGVQLAGLPENPPIAVCIPVGVLAIGGFIGSIWLLARSRPALATMEAAIPTS